MKRALTAHENTNMHGGAHTSNGNIARQALKEGRDIIVHSRHYDGQRYHYCKFRVTNLRQLKDGRIIGDTEYGEIWEATFDVCDYAKTGQI